MKINKILATALVVALSSTAMPAFADDSIPTSQSQSAIVTYSLDDVQKLVKANATTNDTLKLQQNILASAKKQANDGLSDLQGTSSNMNWLKEKMNEAEKNNDIASYNYYYSYYSATQTSIAQASGGSLDNAIDNVIKQIDKICDNEDDLKRMQKDLPTDLTLTATYVYTNILEMQDSLKLIDTNLLLLQQNQKITQLQKDLGMATTQNVEQINLSISELNANKNSLNNGINNMKRTLNDLMGNDLNKQFNLEANTLSVDVSILPYLTSEQTNDIVENNLEYQQKVRDLKNTNDDIKNEKNNNNNSTTLSNLKNTQTQNQLDIDSQKNTVLNTINNKRNQTITAKNTYQNAISKNNDALQTLAYTELRYTLGLVSKIELDSAKATALEKEQALTTATNDYYFALQDYNLYINGTITNTYSAMRSAF